MRKQQLSRQKPVKCLVACSGTFSQAKAWCEIFHSSFHATQFKIKLRFSSDNNPHLFLKIRLALKYRPSTNGEHELLLKNALGRNFEVTRFTVLKTT